MQIRVDVIVMFEENAHYLKEWVVKVETKGGQAITTGDDLNQTNEAVWSELALTINNRARTGNHEQLEIFLYLRNGLLATLNYYGILKRIAVAAQHYVWASNVYVVWDRETMDEKRGGHTTLVENEQFCGTDNANMLVDFYKVLLQEKITGLLKIPSAWKASGRLTTEEVRTKLHGRAVTSRRQRAELKAMVHRDGWSYVFRNEVREWDYLLNRFVKEGYLPSSAPNHLLIFDSASRYDELLAKFKGTNRVAAATDESYTEPVRRACDEEMPPVELLRFHNIFEVIYALLQLNDAGKSDQRPEHIHFHPAEHERVHSDTVEIERVEIIARPWFRLPTATPGRNLLITSAFDDEFEPNHAKAAAQEIGAIRRNVTALQDVEVYPYMSCQSFPKVLESKEYTAWIHMSHGSEGGLYDPKKKAHVAPEWWLNCFSAYAGSLSLALFSSCDSAHVAKMFAEAGVLVAIGFKNRVLPAATEILAQRIVPAAMRSSGDQEVILEAFRDACRRLAARITEDGENYRDSQPVAFCARWK